MPEGFFYSLPDTFDTAAVSSGSTQTRLATGTLIFIAGNRCSGVHEPISSMLKIQLSSNGAGTTSQANQRY
jgi:hypothetical protein